MAIPLLKVLAEAYHTTNAWGHKTTRGVPLSARLTSEHYTANADVVKSSQARFTAFCPREYSIGMQNGQEADSFVAQNWQQMAIMDRLCGAIRWRGPGQDNPAAGAEAPTEQPVQEKRVGYPPPRDRGACHPSPEGNGPLYLAACSTLARTSLLAPAKVTQTRTGRETLPRRRFSSWHVLLSHKAKVTQDEPVQFLIVLRFDQFVHRLPIQRQLHQPQKHLHTIP